MIIQENGYHIWEEKDLKFLKSNYETKSNAELAEALGIKLTTCRTKLYSMGLKRMELEYWTDEQVKYLKEHYKEIGDTELAQLFNDKWHKAKGWTKKHIEKKRRYLKLKRTKAERKQIKKRNTENGMFADGARKAWETMGVTPIGEIKIWKQHYGGKVGVIKTEEGFVHYNRWLYEQNFGPLKSEDLVITRSGEIIALDLNDLEVIDRAEHVRRNSLKKYPEELRETVKLIRKLNKELNTKKNG